MNLFRQAGPDVGVLLAYHELGTHDGRPYPPDNVLKVLRIPLAGEHHALPVPLVHIERVHVVQLLIRTDGVHIGVDAIARLNAILRKGKAFPLGEGMHYLADLAAHVLHGETHSTLHTVKIVVDTHPPLHEQGCGHTAQAQFRSEVHLEEVLDLLDGPFGLPRVQQRPVITWYLQFHFLQSFPASSAGRRERPGWRSGLS